MPVYGVILKPSADKAIRRLPVQVQRRIVAAIDALASEPRPAGAVKLQGADEFWRIRVGQYRVIYAIHDDALVVLVVRIAHRKDVYRP